MSTTTIAQTGSAKATFSIGDGPLNSNVTCSSGLNVVIEFTGNWSSSIDLNWQDPTTTDWWWFHFEGTGTMENTTVDYVSITEGQGDSGYNILNDWMSNSAASGEPIAAAILWDTVPNNFVGTWYMTVNASSIPNVSDPNGPDVAVKIASVVIDVAAGSVSTTPYPAAEEIAKMRAANAEERQRRLGGRPVPGAGSSK